MRVTAKEHVGIPMVQCTSAIFFKARTMAPEPIDYRAEKSLRGSGEMINFLASNHMMV
jgi:hypothetical protein